MSSKKKADAKNKKAVVEPKKKKPEKNVSPKVSLPTRIKKKLKRPGSFSIAFQLSAEQLAVRALLCVIADIVCAVLAFFALLYNTEMELLGRFTWFRSVSFGFTGGSGVKELLRSAVIRVDNGTVKETVSVGNYALFFFVALIALVAAEFIFMIISCVVIPGRTYERLKPLYNMTEAAQALKNIDITSADGADDGDFEIHTGKEELAGLEDAVNDLLRRARSSYQSQIRFVSDASHELRTPIAVIQGYANMLDRWGREDKEILDESIESIKSEAENMNRLVQNLLFLARGDSGRAVIRFEKLDVNRLICDIYEEFVMIDKDHEFQLDLRADVSAVADMSLIKQCLRILVDNAIKYSPEGTDIILRLQKRDEKFYSIDVQDYGIGIKPDEIEKIFERFYRSDPARNRSNGGYGLGLSIAKWIADKHGGYFEVLSYEKLGTRISLVLPYERDDEVMKS